MRRIGIKYCIYIVALLLGDWLLLAIQIDDYLMVLVYGLVLLLLNMILKPILLVLAIPINMITFGLFSIVINSFTIQIADALIGSIDIDGFLPGLLVASMVVLMVTILTPKSNYASSDVQVGILRQ